MSAGPQLFRINNQSRESSRMEEVDFSRLGLQERRDIQEWIATNPGILGDNLLIVGKEFSNFDRTSERLDLLAVDADGKLVIIELKRDDTGTNAHWQAIKYASYLRDASQDDIVGMLARHESISEADATQKLLQHLGSDDLNALNNDQRIVLASHRFAPEVTSACLWLNEKVPGDDLITCVQLTPHHDAESGSLYVQVNTIIPVPGTEDLSIGISDGQDPVSDGSSGLGEALRKTFARSIRHETTPFLRSVADITQKGLPEAVRPDRRSRWAGQGGGHRYYHLWYSRQPWGNWTTSYQVNLNRDESSSWRAVVLFETYDSGLKERLVNSIDRFDERVSGSHSSEALDDAFAKDIASTLMRLINELTPVVDKEYDNLQNDEQA